MKESRFIAQNKEKWIESESLLSDSVKDPEKLSNLFTQVVDDLSFSRTYYKHRSVRVYLNQLAREYFNIIYSSQSEKKNRFKVFWLDELPQLMIFARKPMLISLMVFLLAVAMGVFSSIKDPDFASNILGQKYVEMTKENIKNGDPMAVYKSGHQINMFLGITLNNLWVAFYTYFMGLFAGIGAIAALISNGIMVGCFQYFFIQHGLLAKSALSIWLHGTLEISSIVLAGGAGLTLGSGLLFPGTYSRLQSLQISGARSLKIMLGITPVFVIAAVIESFLTRYTEVPDIVKLLLIVLSAVFIVGYFIIYPWRKSLQGFESPLKAPRIAPDSREMLRLDMIKNNGEIVQDMFPFFRQSAARFMPWVVWVSVLTTASDALLRLDDEQFRAVPTSFWDFIGYLFYALKTPDIWHVLLYALGSGIILYRVISLLLEKEKATHDQSRIPPKRKVQWLLLIQLVALMAALYFLPFALGEWGGVLLAVIFGFVLVIAVVQLDLGMNIFSSIIRAVRLIGSGMDRLIGLQMILLVMSFSFLLIVSGPLIFTLAKYLQWNFSASDTWVINATTVIFSFIRIFAFNLILPLMAVGAGLFYYSINEIHDAENLKKSIAMLGGRLKNFRK